ncbi:MAG: hypothetical protein H0V17_11190, partial [Deltaproteobacteria bacterium]|nr:hypothetical protein [Deltaproteobacteria bacterium]
SALARLRAELEEEHAIAVADAVAAIRRETTEARTETVSELTTTHGTAVTTLVDEHERELAHDKSELARIEDELATAQRSHGVALADLRTTHADAIAELTSRLESQRSTHDMDRIATQTRTAETHRHAITDLETQLARATRPLDVELAATQSELSEQAAQHRRALADLEQRLRSEHASDLTALRDQHRELADAAKLRLAAATTEPEPTDQRATRQQIAATESAAAEIVQREQIRGVLRAEFGTGAVLGSGAAPADASIRVTEPLAERTGNGAKRAGYERQKLEALDITTHDLRPTPMAGGAAALATIVPPGITKRVPRTAMIAAALAVVLAIVIFVATR